MQIKTVKRAAMCSSIWAEGVKPAARESSAVSARAHPSLMSGLEAGLREPAEAVQTLTRCSVARSISETRSRHWAASWVGSAESGREGSSDASRAAVSSGTKELASLASSSIAVASSTSLLWTCTVLVTSMVRATCVKTSSLTTPIVWRRQIC